MTLVIFNRLFRIHDNFAGLWINPVSAKGVDGFRHDIHLPSWVRGRVGRAAVLCCIPTNITRLGPSTPLSGHVFEYRALPVRSS